MSKSVKPIPALQIVAEGIITPQRPQTVVDFLNDIGEILADIRQEWPGLIDDSDIQKSIAGIYKAFHVIEKNRSVDDNKILESTNNESDSGDEPTWSTKEINLEDIQEGLYVGESNNDLREYIKWASLGLLHRIAYSSGQIKPVQQIIAVEVFHSVIDSLGITYFDPRGEKYFQEYVDLAMKSGMIKYSSWLLKESIRAYRNAEQSGRLFQLNKIQNKNDGTKVIDYYSFLPNGGRAVALRDLRGLGIPDEHLKQVVDHANEYLNEELRDMRKLSGEAEKLIIR